MQAGEAGRPVLAAGMLKGIMSKMRYGMRRAANATAASRIIRECLTAGRYRRLRHFAQRMDERGLFWPDVLAVVNAPRRVRADGDDEFGRPRWIVAGTTTDGLTIEIVCVLERDEKGNVVVLITLYYEA